MFFLVQIVRISVSISNNTACYCLQNNYKGQPSYINTVLDAVTEESKLGGFEVAYAEGSEQVGDGPANATGAFPYNP